LTLTTPSKVKSVVSSYVPTQPKQLLFETFFSENASLKKYFGATFKMGHPVYDDVISIDRKLNIAGFKNIIE